MDRTNMKSLHWALLLLSASFLAKEVHCQEKRGYMFVAPKQLHEETNETMCIMFNGLEDSDANVTITLYNEKNESVSSNNYNVSKAGRLFWYCITDFHVPKVDNFKSYLNLRVSFPDLAYAVDETKVVAFAYTPGRGTTTFLETDKDKYKYGQTVKFRILSMDYDSKPLTDPIPEVWIEDPGLNRVAQWRNVSMKHGLTQLNYTLSEDPPKGAWTIRVKSNFGEEQISFQVEEYVLPKFSMTIKSQRDGYNIYTNDKNYTWTVCANYTHGEGMIGTINVTFASVSFGGWRNNYKREENVSTLLDNHQFFGCQEVTITNETFGQFRQYQQVELRASVEEEGTGITLNKSSIHYVSVNYVTIMHDREEYFKPGIYYEGELRFEDSDAKTLANTDFELCVEYFNKTCENFTSGADGKFRYLVLPAIEHDFNNTIRSLRVQVKLLDENQSSRGPPEQLFSSSAWHSNAYKFMELKKQQEGDKFKCNQTYQMELLYTPPPTNVRASIAVMSAGRIVRTTTIELGPNDPIAPTPSADYVVDLNDGAQAPDVLHKTFPLEIKADISEKFNILVHYTLEDGEVIATGRNFDADVCVQHKVVLKWSKDKPLPGEDIQLEMQAAPQSVCGVSVVDRSVKLLSSNNQFKKSNLLNRRPWLHLYQYSYPTQQEDYLYCLKKNSSEMRAKRSLLPSYYYDGSADSITAFDIAGLIVMTDLTLETRPCNRQHRPELLEKMPEEVNKVQVDAEVALGGPSPGESAFAAPAAPPPSRRTTTTIREDFPETWLFDLEYMEDADVIQKQLKVPDTITEWVGSGYCLSSSEGLGMSDEASFISFTPFFIDYNLPYSVKRGETFQLKVSVFNYLDINAPITLELQESSEFEVSDGVYNKSVIIPPNRSKVMTYEVTATSLGQVNITSFAYLSPENETDPTYANISLPSDAIRRAVLVEAEGFPREHHQVEFMCVQDNAQLTKFLDCSPPSSIVPDSAKTTYSVTGDLLGPVLTNLDSFIRIPTGCGEQNMATLVPNIHALTYLQSIAASEPELVLKSRKHMKEGYQRQLKYKHRDGSYSAFGEDDNTEIGSIWLTAFVLKSFGQAKPYTYIDEKIMNEGKAFILQHQMRDGCFQKVGKVFHTAMKGGVGQTNDTKVLTAYIISALLEAGEDPTSEHMIKALQCITDLPNTPYAQALGAYAFLLSIFRQNKSQSFPFGSVLKPRLFGKLRRVSEDTDQQNKSQSLPFGSDLKPRLFGRLRRVSEDTDRPLAARIFHTSVESSDTSVGTAEQPKLSQDARTLGLRQSTLEFLDLRPKEIANTYLSQLRQTAKQEQQLMWWEQEAGCQYCKDSNVEIAGYALMAFLLGNSTDWTSSRPIARYLISQRNTHGAFYSTQDTVVALEALTKYAMQAEEVPLKQVTVSCEACDPTVTNTITPENRLIINKVHVGKSLSGNVVLQGNGCAIVQCSIEYNIPEAEPKVAFELNAISRPLDGASQCKRAGLQICTSYVLDAGESNMAVVEINMVSGYKPDRASLDDNLNVLDLDLKRYEEENNKVNMYFDYFDQNEKCFAIILNQENVVTNPKPAIVKVYDYYQTELTTSTSYSVCSDIPADSSPPAV